MPICTKCGVEKDDSEFSKEPRKSNGLNSHCKKCKAEARKKWYGPTIVEQLRQRVAELEKERDEALRVTFNPAVLEEMNNLTAERDALKLTLNTFQQAVEHVTEKGNTRRAFSTREGWAMIHKDRLLDLEIIEERCDALKQQRDKLVHAAQLCIKENVFAPLMKAIANVKEKA